MEIITNGFLNTYLNPPLLVRQNAKNNLFLNFNLNLNLNQEIVLDECIYKNLVMNAENNNNNNNISKIKKYNSEKYISNSIQWVSLNKRRSTQSL